MCVCVRVCVCVCYPVIVPYALSVKTDLSSVYLLRLVWLHVCLNQSILSSWNENQKSISQKC